MYKSMSGWLASKYVQHERLVVKIEWLGHAGHCAEARTTLFDDGHYLLHMRCSCGAEYDHLLPNRWERNPVRQEGDRTLAPIADAILWNR